MTTRRMIRGAGWLVLLAQAAGCHREEPSVAPQAPSAVHGTGIESPERPDPQSDGATETDPPVPAMTVAPSENAAIERLAADLGRLADPRTLPEDWEAAQNRILEQGREAVPVLAEGLASDRPLVREMAATLLTMIGDGLDEAEPELRTALRDESVYVRANAATALCQLPDTEDAVIPVLAELLESADPNLRQIAATNLGNFGPEAAPFVDRLAGSLDNDRPEVLMPVVELLGRIGPAAEAAAPKLRQIAFEQSGDVQAAATAALERIEAGD